VGVTVGVFVGVGVLVDVGVGVALLLHEEQLIQGPVTIVAACANGFGEIGVTV
jgi:hypothetical protein